MLIDKSSLGRCQVLYHPPTLAEHTRKHQRDSKAVRAAIWNTLQDQIQRVPQRYTLVLLGDLNCQLAAAERSECRAQSGDRDWSLAPRSGEAARSTRRPRLGTFEFMELRGRSHLRPFQKLESYRPYHHAGSAVRPQSQTSAHGQSRTCRMATWGETFPSRSQYPSARFL